MELSSAHCAFSQDSCYLFVLFILFFFSALLKYPWSITYIKSSHSSHLTCEEWVPMVLGSTTPPFILTSLALKMLRMGKEIKFCVLDLWYRARWGFGWTNVQLSWNILYFIMPWLCPAVKTVWILINLAPSTWWLVKSLSNSGIRLSFNLTWMPV